MVFPSSEVCCPLLSLSPHCQNRSPAMPPDASAREACCQVFSTAQWLELTPSVCTYGRQHSASWISGWKSPVSLTFFQQTRLARCRTGLCVILDPRGPETIVNAPYQGISDYDLYPVGYGKGYSQLPGYIWKVPKSKLGISRFLTKSTPSLVPYG